jgi:hypothetical protein
MYVYITMPVAKIHKGDDTDKVNRTIIYYMNNVVSHGTCVAIGLVLIGSVNSHM